MRFTVAFLSPRTARLFARETMRGERSGGSWRWVFREMFSSGMTFESADRAV